MSGSASDSRRFKPDVRRIAHNPNIQVVLGLAALVGLTAYFTTTGASSLSTFTFNAWLLACIGAIALNLLMGTSGLVSIGNVGFLAAGAFSTVWLSVLGVPFPLTVVGSALLTAAIGGVVGLPALRLRGLELGLATIAAHFIILFVARTYQSDQVGAGSFQLKPVFSARHYQDGQHRWSWILLGAVAFTIVVVSLLARNKAGRSLRLIRDHEIIAPALGIPVTRYKVTVFMVSSGLIGMQGSLMAHYQSSLSVESFTLILAIEYLAMVLIGGLDSIAGSVIGAGIVTLLPVYAPQILGGVIGDKTANSYQPQIAQILYGVLIVVVIAIAPTGIAGSLRGLANRMSRGSRA
jgi:branched-chain amino acid transport system permease protein